MVGPVDAGEVVDMVLAGFGYIGRKDALGDHSGMDEVPQHIADVDVELDRHDSHSLSVIGVGETTAQTS